MMYLLFAAIGVCIAIMSDFTLQGDTSMYAAALLCAALYCAAVGAGELKRGVFGTKRYAFLCAATFSGAFLFTFWGECVTLPLYIIPSLAFGVLAFLSINQSFNCENKKIGIDE